ncbi:MAG: DUF59 domain-containing protein [Verrucomicrobia bacterium]|nr:DUF59 domain-containing protein [Verrucomicrobiota bacterium]
MTENPGIDPQPNQEPLQPSTQEQVSPADAVTAPETQTAAEAPVVTESEVWDALRLVFDPEVPINIVDMGLVYDVRVEGKKVFVKMTLTMPGCMMGPSIAGDAQVRILALPGVEEANVEMVWDPPWHPSMMSEDAKVRLGMDL